MYNYRRPEWSPSYRELFYNFFQGLARSTVLRDSRCSTLKSFKVTSLFWTIPLHVRPSTNAPTRTQCQWFLSNPPRSFFKKLIVSTPTLHQELHTMSLAKLVPDGLKNHEFKRSRMREPPPVHYLPEKDKVQETVSTKKGLQLKTSIGKDTTLLLCGTAIQRRLC